MRVAFDIDQQSLKMTGIQHYVDSLLTALMAVNTPHEIVAWSPRSWTRAKLMKAAQDGLFEWILSPRASLDTAGSHLNLSNYCPDSPLLQKVSRRIDGRIIGPLLDRTSLTRTRRQMRRYDVMHVPDAGALEFVQYQAKNYVATVYDIAPIACPEPDVQAAVSAWVRYFEFARDKCARIVVISEFTKRSLMEHLGVAAEKIDVTPLAARSSAVRVTDPNAIKKDLEPLGLQGQPFVLYAGTLELRKNLVNLLGAFQRARAAGNNTDLKLVLAGGWRKNYDAELRAACEDLGIGPQVIMTGYVSNQQMNALMSSCEAFAYVSKYEGFGLPPLEAMICGAPVVASNTTSLPEVVGDAGLLVDPQDVEAIAGALHTLLTDAEENRRRRALSLEQAQRFSWERTARLTLQSYEAAVA